MRHDASLRSLAARSEAAPEIPTLAEAGLPGYEATGWFGIGGTSLSSPLWAAVTADRDSYQGRRTGNINPLLYYWLRTNPSRYFTDITGRGPLQSPERESKRNKGWSWSSLVFLPRTRISQRARRIAASDGW